MGRVERGIHHGTSGVWLEVGGARAFVMAEPYPRVTLYETKGHRSLLHPMQSHEYFGIRSWFLEPDQTDQSGLPALQPARIETEGAQAVTLKTEKDHISGLSLRMRVALDPDTGALLMTHSFRNETPRMRKMAPWGIVAVTPRELVGFTRWRSGTRRALILTAPSRACDRILFHNARTLAVDFAARPETDFLKVGTDTDCGWVACADDDTALWVHSAFDPEGTYPEAGGTVTMFRSGNDEPGDFAEVETVGPMRLVRSGETMTLQQRITMTAGLAGHTADEFVASLDGEAG